MWIFKINLVRDCVVIDWVKILNCNYKLFIRKILKVKVVVW